MVDTPAIKFENISKTFQTADNEVKAVQNVNLEIKSGEVFGIVGFSGAGKSTLVRMLNGLEKPTEGKILIHGKRVDNLAGRDLREQRKKIGIIFQHFNLLDFVRCTETIEEVHERNARFDGSQVSNTSQIHNFLYRAFSQHSKASLTS